MKRNILITILLISILLITPLNALAASAKFTVLSVTPEKSVTLMAEGLPKDKTFDVYFGRMGTRGVGGTYVGSMRANGLGRAISTFTIPLALSKDYQIDVMLISYKDNGKPDQKYYTQFINLQNSTGLTFEKIVPTRNVTIRVVGLQEKSRYTVWMMATPNSTPYKAAMFETKDKKTFAVVQVPIPYKLRGEPALYVVIVKDGMIVTQGYFYNR